MIGLTSVTSSLVDWILSSEFISNLVGQVDTSGTFDFVSFVILAVIANVLIIYSYAILKGLLKKCILDPAYGFTKRQKRINYI